MFRTALCTEKNTDTGAPTRTTTRHQRDGNQRQTPVHEPTRSDTMNGHFSIASLLTLENAKLLSGQEFDLSL